MPANPSQPLGMRKNGHISRHEKVEEQVFEAQRGNVMRRFDQHVSAVVEAEQVTCPQLGHEIDGDVIVRSRCQTERHAGQIEASLKLAHSPPDLRTGIVVEPGKDVRRACNDLDALSRQRFGHAKRSRKVAGAVVEPG